MEEKTERKQLKAGKENVGLETPVGKGTVWTVTFILCCAILLAAFAVAGLAATGSKSGKGVEQKSGAVLSDVCLRDFSTVRPAKAFPIKSLCLPATNG